MDNDKNIKNGPKGEPNSDAVDQSVDKGSPISLEEAQQIMNNDEGNIEAEIDKERIDKQKEVAPDLEKMRQEKADAEKEVKDTKQEVEKEAKETEAEKPKEEMPSKFANKTEEERLKIYKDMESGYTKLSQKVKDYEEKVKELETINSKIEEYEKQAVAQGQQAKNLPQYPADDLYFDDPIKHNRQVKAYTEALIKSSVNPIYGKTYSMEKQKAINELKERTEKDFLPYKDVEAEVENRLKKNPALFNQHKLKAREVVYNEIKAEKLPDKLAEIKQKAVEEAREELLGERQVKNNAQVMTSDITTQRRESKPVDFRDQLDSEDNPEKVIQGIRKKYNIRHDI